MHFQKTARLKRQNPARMFDKDEVKNAASNRWIEILTALTRVDSKILDGDNAPCPKCGGRDRFRMIDETAGALFCNSCFSSRNGDGIAAVMWLLDCDFKTALTNIGDYLGLKPPQKKTTGGKPSKIDPAAQLDFVTWNKQLANLWCLKKNPITEEALLKLGAKQATYKFQNDNFKVIAIPTTQPGSEKPVGWTIYNITGGTLPKGSEGTEQVKVKLTYGSKAGIIGRIDPDATEVWKTEGPTDLLAFLSLDLPAGVSAFCNANGAKENPTKSFDWLPGLLESKKVFVIHDCDEPGQQGATIIQQSNGERIGWSPFLATAKGSVVRNVVLPYPIEPTNGKDLRDWLAENNGYKELIKLADDSELIEPVDPLEITESCDAKDVKPLVEIKHDESETNKEVIMALSNLGWSSGWVPEDEHETVRIYTRGDRLVSIQETNNPDLPKGTCRIHFLPEVIVRERITQACQLWKTVETNDGEEIRYVHPPRHLCQQIHQRGDYGGHIKPLNGIVQAPTIRKDGSILQTAGYDESTGLIYKPISEFPTVPDEPTLAQVHSAIDALLHVVVDFPFKTDSDKSAWLSMVFSMIARHCIDGCVPMFCLTANIRGAGKGRLVDCASIIAYGRPAARRAYTPDNDEMRKAITAIAIDADPCVLLDNISTTIQGASLDAALTSQTWKDRILGKSQSTAELPLRTIWAATGNNLS